MAGSGQTQPPASLVQLFKFRKFLDTLKTTHPAKSAPAVGHSECPDATLQETIAEGRKAAAGCLTYSEYRVTEYKLGRRLRQEDGDALLKMLRDPRFQVNEIRTNSMRTLEDWAQKANDIQHWEINLKEECDGNQELVLFLRDIESVIRLIMQDPEYEGYVYMGYEHMTAADGQRTFDTVNSGLFFQINCHAVGAEHTLLALALFIDGSLVRQNIHVKPALGKCKHARCIHGSLSECSVSSAFSFSSALHLTLLYVLHLQWRC